MDNRKRRLIAAVVLLLSLLIVVWLVLFTPNETKFSALAPTPSGDATPISHLLRESAVEPR